MTEKNIFVYKLFLSLNISDFSLSFYVKPAAPPTSPPKKSPPFSPLSRKGEGCTLCRERGL